MCDITSTLWFLLFSTAAMADVFYFNEEIDGFFSEFREDIKKANNCQFPLPNIHAVYTKDILFLGLHGEMNGTKGIVKDISTIKRTSNVSIVTAKEYFLFRAEFGFDVLKVEYKYKAKLIGIPFKGDLEVNVGNNSIYIELLVNLTSDRCSGSVITIRDLRFTSLDKISVRLTGFSIVNRLVGYWLSRSFGDVSASVTEPIEEALRVFFKDNISQFDFCKFGTVPENIPFEDKDSSDDIMNTVAYGSNGTLKISAVLN